ncbi:MAG: type II toxin-antitoxin system RelE/ParE family toxin [Oscillospiraceae bacterium]|nr:type II toxin-antitoxin system RelE/ParE family toxin [Oscillospiraceae bacterium]
MKKYNLHYTGEARRDMDEIWNYITRELRNRLAAERVTNSIMDAVDRLEDFAESGTPLSSIADVDEDYRFLISGNYMIFSRVADSDVYIDRILYSHRDYLHILLGDSAQQE